LDHPINIFVKQNQKDEKDTKFFSNSSLEGVPSPKRPNNNNKRNHSKKLLALEPQLKSKIQYLTRLNRQRCSFLKPMYGTDLQECLHTMMTSLTSQINSNVYTTTTAAAATKRPFATTHALQRLLNFTANMVVNTSDPSLVDVLNRFLLYIPHVVFATKQASDLGENGFVRMRVPHPMGHGVGRQRVLIEEIGQCAKAYGVYILFQLQKRLIIIVSKSK
jgi:hypothetical protein